MKISGEYYLAFEIGGTNLRIAVIDDTMNILEFEKMPTQLLLKEKNVVDFFAIVISNYFKKYMKEKCIGITFALASLINAERNTIYSSPMIENLQNIKLVELLEKKFHIPIFIEKDLNCLLDYEINKSNLSGPGIVLAVFLGTGLGSAFSINGKSYKGFSGSSAELGHIPVPYLKEKCDCGKFGCIELKATGKILEKIAEEQFNCSLDNLFPLHKEERQLKEVLYYYSIAIATAVTILDPYMLILGGGVLNILGFPYEELIREIKSNLRYPNPRNSLAIEKASGDDVAGVVGAVLNAKSLLEGR